MVIGHSSAFWDWIKTRPLLSFLILSLLVHFIVISLTGGWGRLTGSITRELIEFDFRESRIPAGKEELEPPPPPPPQQEVAEAAPPEAAAPEPPLAGKEIADFPAAAEVSIPRDPAVISDLENARGRALAAYIDYLQNIIDLQLEYPEQATREGREGQVTVVFTLNRKGELLALDIPRDGLSPFHPFNREARQAVSKAARYFDGFPRELDGEEITFRLPITFSLR